MKVVTLYNEEFYLACDRLHSGVLHSYSPDTVVAIANGGCHVADALFAAATHVRAVCRRPSSDGKSSRHYLFKIVRRLPKFMRNAMRIVEAFLLSHHHPSDRTLEISETDRAKIAQGRRILIVDDAVDSGATLQKVYEEVQRLAPKARIRTAAIALTTAHPIRVPDYYLYRNVLVRFPWSLDYCPSRRKG